MLVIVFYFEFNFLHNVCTTIQIETFLVWVSILCPVMSWIYGLRY